MCGISGIVGRSAGHDHNRMIVQRMNDRLYHRGPNDSGIAKDDDFIFGHRRLSIIDIDHGAQPMRTEDGAITLTFNGEIYNYIELREEIIAKGGKFTTDSDTEVLLRLYEESGEDCLSRLNGMFAFAIFDRRQNRFFAARDPYGIKPFYYSCLPSGELVFASEPKAILEHPDVMPRASTSAIAEYLTFQFCLGSQTVFDSIHKLEPGRFISWSPGKGGAPESRTYWQPTFEIDETPNLDEFLQQARSLLSDAVNIQLRSDVPVGAYLSGGLDSSTIAALAARSYDGQLKCFTGRFTEGSEYDESSYAQLVADDISAELLINEPTATDFTKTLPQVIFALDEPLAGPGSFPQFAVSNMAAKHVKVILGGQGGDELFGGYTRYLVAYLEQCLKGGIYDIQEEGKHVVTMNSLIENLPQLKSYVPMLKDFWSSGLFDPMDQRYFRLINRSRNLQGKLGDAVSDTFDSTEIYERYKEQFDAGGYKSYINKMLHFDQRTLLPALLQVEDRMSMASSLECRVPMLDVRFAEFVNSAPPAFKFSGGQLKGMLRRLSKDLLPDAVCNRMDKMGFPVPLHEWLSGGPVLEYVSDILSSQRARERGIFTRQYLDELVASNRPFSREMWGCLSLELWHQIFIDGSTQVTLPSHQ